jgi:hypothetical protein
MIKEALKFLTETYNTERERRDDKHKLLLGNIGFREELGKTNAGNVAVSLSAGITSDLRLTLIGIDEERILKNQPHIRTSPIGYSYKKPPLHVNLFLLITANYGHDGKNYEDGLDALANVLGFFQERPILNFREYPYALKDDILIQYLDWQIEMELLSLSLEEMYHLWGVLGGKILPSVMYKARLIPIEEERLSREGKPIESIKVNLPSSEL